MSEKIVKTETFPILSAGIEHAQQMAAAMKENVGEVSIFDLSEVNIPAGGGTTWELETLEEAVAVKKVPAVILIAQDVRAYYETEYDGGNEPPTCSSPDGVTGYGIPGGNCADCLHAQWGSGREGRGQACQQRKQLLLLTEYGNLPYLLNVPPTSLKPLRKYMMALTGQSLAYYTAMTELSLEKAQNATGIEYARLACKFVRPLGEDERAVAEAYRDALMALLAAGVRLPEAKPEG
jgi:hypothetical protein